MYKRQAPIKEAAWFALPQFVTPDFSWAAIIYMVPVAIAPVIEQDVYKRQGEGSETWRPMGIAVIGGMVFSTIITMIIVPAVYAAMDKSGSRDKKKILSKQFKFMADFNPERDLPKKK